MDKAADSGSADAGSIPVRDTKRNVSLDGMHFFFLG